MAKAHIWPKIEVKIYNNKFYNYINNNKITLPSGEPTSLFIFLWMNRSKCKYKICMFIYCTQGMVIIVKQIQAHPT